MKKKVLSMLVTIAMLFSLLLATALAAEGGYVAQVGETQYTDIQEAIQAAAPSGTVELLDDVTVEEWVMFSETLSIGNGNIIALDSINGLTIDGGNHTLTINSIESAGNGDRLFYDATKLNIKDLTIEYNDGVAGGIGLESGTLENVTFNGGVYGVLPGNGDVTIEGCTFKTNGTAIYFEEERDELKVSDNVFELGSETNVILLRGDVVFENNDVVSGRTVNVVSGSPVVSGNNFNNVRFKVYNAATATIEGNQINTLVFDDENAPVYSTFADDNKLSDDAQEVLDSLAEVVWPAPTEEDPLIRNLAQLKAFRDAVNAGNNYQGVTVELAADINLGGEEWTPIDSFAGEFDGNNHTISNFHIDATASDGGFFNTIEAGEGERVHDLILSDVTATVGAHRFGTLANSIRGVVHNVTVKNVTVTTTHSEAWVGGMAAFMYWPWMTNCTVEKLTVDAMEGAQFVAGFACILQKNSNHVFDNLDVKGFKVTVFDTDGSCGVAGFVGQTQRGWEYPKMINCDVSGIDVTATGTVDVGGFIAWPGAHTTCVNCTTEGKIDVTGVTSDGCFAGGFFGNLGWNADLGQMGHVVTGCSADVNIITSVAPAGGFVGSATNSNDKSMYATFNNCSASGDIEAVQGGTADIGGFAGDADRGVYNDCSASGTVINSGSGSAGQFVGAIYDVEPQYDSSFPWGTRAYGVDEITVAGYTYTGTSADLEFIGYTDEGTNVTQVTRVAQVGNVKYNSLQEAINAAKPGDTITLLADVDVTGSITISDELTIDLNGHTLTGTDTATDSFGLINIQPGAELTIKDSSEAGTGRITLTATTNREWSAYSSVISNQRGKLTVNGGTIEHFGGTDMAYAIDNLTNTGAEIAETTINDGVIKSTYRAIRQFLNSSAEGVNNILTVYGGTIEGDNKSIWMQDANTSANIGTLTVSDEAILVGDVYLFVTEGSAEWPVSVSIADDAFADGYTVMHKNVPPGTKVDVVGGYWGISDANTSYVAAIKGVSYTTLQDAIDNAKDGDTILILDDVPLKKGLNVAGDDQIIIDLNGMTVSYETTESKADDMIVNKGDLTITDSSDEQKGKLSYKYSGTADTSYSYDNATIQNEGNLTIKAGTVENTTDVMSHASYAINTNAGATLNVKGGKVLNLNGHAIRQVSFGTAANVVNISGGYIEGTRAVQFQLPGSTSATTAPEMTLNITGGELKSNENTYNLAVYVYSHGQSAKNAKVSVSGDAVINGNIALNGAATASMTEGSASVTGGRLNGEYGIFSYAEEDTNNVLTITGGTFATKYAEMYAEDGYVFESYVDGEGKTVYGVKPTYSVTITVIPADATIVVKDSEGNEVVAEDDGSYVLTNGTYTYSVTRAGYNAENGNFTVDGGPKTVEVSLSPKSSGGGGGGSSSYSITVEETENGDITVSPSRASSGSTVTITVDPDSGYELDELTVLDKNGKEIKLTRKSDSKYTFKMPSGKVTIEATFAEIEAFENPFTDVAEGAYYYDAVLWAAENGITGGTSATTFSPAVTCTRAQTMTFLWRAAGSPEPETTVCPFTDVTPDKYYYDAVLWAVENGITSGTSATTFSPNATVTRAQNVTFLWRWAESSAVEAVNPETDVPADVYYHDAVLRAAEEGITAGTSATTFSPDDPCLRSQIMTYLYRYLVK